MCFLFILFIFYNTFNLLIVSSNTPQLYFDFLPEPVTTLHNNITQNLYNNTNCFEYNTYSLNINNNNLLEFTIDSVNKQSLLCNDYYFFGTNKFINFHNKILPGKYTYTKLLDNYSQKDIEINGFHIFYFNKGLLYSLKNAYDTYS